ncbi:MAG: hypothetical protein ACQETH_06780 [Candidatus Rifleibacteriota bacterium]
MKQMKHLIGVLTDFSDKAMTVTETRSGQEFYFQPGDLEEVELGEKIDLLIADAPDSEGFCQVLIQKKKKKTKPFRMPNFSTLLKHMIKTRDRLKVTLEENPETENYSEINEKIEYLDRGIELFKNG